MRVLIIIFFLTCHFLTSAQTEDCGNQNFLKTWEGEYQLARGEMVSDVWKYATKVYYSNQETFRGDLFGFSQTEDTLYYLGKDKVCFIDIDRKKKVERLFFECSRDLDELRELEIDRSLLAAIPNHINSQEGCPDSTTTGFHLWYSAEGDAKYQLFGQILSYSQPKDTIQDIVEDKIRKKECEELKANTAISTKSKKNIVIRRGYCTDSKINNKDQIEILRGEVIEYKGVKIDNDIITFSGDNFKITFAPGTVKLKKLAGGGKMNFISNRKWN
jgi:hypothetical protein